MHHVYTHLLLHCEGVALINAIHHSCAHSAANQHRWHQRCDSGGSSSSGRKRTADQISNTASSSTTTEKVTAAMTTIVIPSSLSAKDAKKFRKDERRKARLGGISDDRIEFIVEGQSQKKSSPKSPSTASKETKEHATSTDVQQKKKEYMNIYVNY